MTVFGSTDKIYTAYYYDIRGRVTKKVQSNLLGGYDVTTTTYTFTDHPATVTHEHTASGKASRTEVYTYSYDEKERLIKIMHKLGSTTVTLAEYTYDALGRQATKKLHGNNTNTSTYSYNIRNWLTGISSTKFTQTLGYGSHYNGNISSMNWNANGSSHSYTFTYDGVQKLLLTEEGYVDLSASTPAYYYYLKDHQGNNRVVVSSGGTVEEVNHYYPFGGVFASTSVQPYKYNGKELDTKKGLNWYDYGARHYDVCTSISSSSSIHMKVCAPSYTSDSVLSF